MDRSAFLPVERMLMSLCDESIFAVDFFFLWIHVDLFRFDSLRIVLTIGSHKRGSTRYLGILGNDRFGMSWFFRVLIIAAHFAIILMEGKINRFKN